MMIIEAFVGAAEAALSLAWVPWKCSAGMRVLYTL